jgi:hypothetical protein
LIDAATASVAPTLSGPDATPDAPTTPDTLEEKPSTEVEPEVDAETRAEAKAFMKWAVKGGAHRRDFTFKHLDPIVGEALNRCAFDGDLDTARALTKAYLT